MSRTCSTVALVAALALLGAAPASATETFQDPLGEVIGTGPDIVAVTIEDSEDIPVVSISVEFAEEPPLDTDRETWTDVIFIGLVTDPETDADGRPLNRVAIADFDADYIVGAHGMTLPDYLDSGGHLVVYEGGDDLYWLVVDVAVDGPTVTWSLDRKLIGDPATMALQAIVGVESDDASEEEYDVFPDEGEPYAIYEFSSSTR